MKKSIRSRVLSVVLSAVMLLVMVPFTAIPAAAEGTTDTICIA